ncbi:MAG: universal stress protein [Bacteroidota bacterium]
MKKIIVPVDFSETAAAALRFGTYLAEVLQLNLEVVHVFDANYSFAQVVSSGALRTAQQQLEEKLVAFTQRHAYPVLATFQGNLEVLPAIKTTVLEGFPGPTVQALSSQADVAFIVMGGVGAGAAIVPKTLFGGVAQKVACNGGCPVILIPKGYGFPTIRRMGVAFAATEDLTALGGVIVTMQRALHPEVYFLHVRHPDLEFELENEEAFLQLANDSGLPVHTYRYETLPSGKVAQQLLTYAAEQHLGLLLIGGKRRDFWAQLLHKGHLKHLLHQAKIPLLVVPFRERRGE